MALLTPGYWPDTYWAENYWTDDYWTDYGAAAVTYKKWWQRNPLVFENMEKEEKPSWQ
jgi:hypothetical protein